MTRRDHFRDLERRAARGDARAAREVASRALESMDKSSTSAYLDLFTGKFQSEASDNLLEATADWVPRGDRVGMQVDIRGPSAAYRRLATWWVRPREARDAQLRFWVHVTPDCTLELAEVGVQGSKFSHLSSARREAFESHARAFDELVADDLISFMEGVGGPEALEEFRRVTLLSFHRGDVEREREIMEQLRAQQDRLAESALAYVQEAARGPRPRRRAT